MKNRFRWLSGLNLIAVLLLLSCAHAALAQDATKKRGGPASGPVIALSRGQGDAAGVPKEASGQPARESTARQRWEYCSIRLGMESKDSFTNVAVAYIHYFRGGNERVEAEHQTTALANAMTKLGDDGWELVAVPVGFSSSHGDGASDYSYIFKRPR